MNSTSKKNLLLVNEIENMCAELGIPCIAGPYLANLANKTSRVMIPASVLLIYACDHEKLLAKLTEADLPGRSVEVIPFGEVYDEEDPEFFGRYAGDALDAYYDDPKPAIRYADKNSTYIDVRDHYQYDCFGINVMIEPIENQKISKAACETFELSRYEAVCRLMEKRKTAEFLGVSVSLPEDMDLYRSLIPPKVNSFPLEVIIVDPDIPYDEAFASIGKAEAEEIRQCAMAKFDIMTELAEANAERKEIMVDAMKQIKAVYKDAEKKIKKKARNTRKR